MKKILVLLLACASMQLGSMDLKSPRKKLSREGQKQRELNQSLLAVSGVPGFEDEAAQLIDQGAQLDFQDEEDGYTPLIAAASTNRQKIARLLIAMDARLDLQNKDGETALIVAVLRDYKEMAYILIDAMLKRTKDQKQSAAAFFHSLKGKPALSHDTRRLAVQNLIELQKQENKAKVLAELDKLKDSPTKRVLIKYVNDKTK